MFSPGQLVRIRDWREPNGRVWFYVNGEPSHRVDNCDEIACILNMTSLIVEVLTKFGTCTVWYGNIECALV